MKLIELMTLYMQDGQPKKLIHIVEACHAMGWMPGMSSQYIGVYKMLRDHPETFERTAPGFYKLKLDLHSPLKHDADQIIGIISGILKRAESMTVNQMWYALRAQDVIVSYTTTEHLLQSPCFKRRQNRYSNK